jgi:hypothetical protein
MNIAHKGWVVELGIGYQPRGAIGRQSVATRRALRLLRLIGGCVVVSDELAVVRGGGRIGELGDLRSRDV